MEPEGEDLDRSGSRAHAQYSLEGELRSRQSLIAVEEALEAVLRMGRNLTVSMRALSLYRTCATDCCNY